MRAIYLVLLFVLVILIYARGELLEHFANNPRADAISKTPVGGKIPPACTPNGSILGFPNGDNTLRLYDSAECVMLRGKIMPDGQCLKSNGKGNYSYECRGLNPVPAANQCNSQSTPAQTLNEEVCRPFFPPPTTINGEVCKPFFPTPTTINADVCKPFFPSLNADVCKPFFPSLNADVCKPFFPSLNADVCKPFFPSLNADVCKPFTPAPLAPTAELCKPFFPSKSFSLKDMEGLQLWFDAADTNSLSLNGNSLVKWMDKSGRGSDATANAGVTWGQKASGNGLPAVLFMNSQWLVGNTSISGNSFTAFCVFNMSAKSKDAARVLSLAAPNAPDYNNNGFIGMLRQPVNKFMNWRNFTRSDNSTIQLDTVQMSTSWVDGITSNIAINGNNPATIPSSGNFSISSFALGCSTQLLDDINAPLYGSICEVILFNTAINSTQRQQVEGYLAWKWGIQSQLPSSHPHKSATPEPIPSQSLCNAQYPSPTISITGQYDTQIFNGRTYYKITGPATFSLKSAAPTFQFFAVGGGGGAGYNNGGGGGGVQTNAGINVYPSQAASMNIVPGAIYTVAIGAGGEGNSNNTNGNGKNTTITGSGVSITALGGSHGGHSGEWCPSSGGGSGGGGCPSSGIQGGSTVANPASNAGAGAGGNPLSYTAGGPGIVYNSVAYGAAAPNSSANTTGTANTGAGGSNGGSGGSGVVILSL